MQRSYDVAGKRLALELESRPDGARIRIDGEDLDVDSFSVGDRFVTLRIGARTYRLAYHIDGQRIRVVHRGRTFEFVPADEDGGQDDAIGRFTAEISSPMPGKVLDVLVAAGDLVEPDTPLLLIEAMKMEQTIRASTAARIVEVRVSAGDRVGPGEILAVLAPPDAAADDDAGAS